MFFDRQEALVMFISPTAVADGPDIDEADLDRLVPAPKAALAMVAASVAARNVRFFMFNSPVVFLQSTPVSPRHGRVVLATRAHWQMRAVGR